MYVHLVCAIRIGSPLATVESEKGTHLKGVERIPR